MGPGRDDSSLQQISRAGSGFTHRLLAGGQVIEHRGVGVGNLRRQCLPGLRRPLPRQRASVRSLMPSSSRASRAVAQALRCWCSITLALRLGVAVPQKG